MCPRRLSHDTRMCKFSHLTVSSCAKVAYVKLLACANAFHVKVPLRANVPQVNVPSCPYIAHRMVPHVSMSPTECQGRIFHDSPMCPCCPSLMAIVFKVANVNVPRMCPSCANVNVPRICPSCKQVSLSKVSLVCKSCLCQGAFADQVAHVSVPRVCQSFPLCGAFAD